MRNGFSVLSVLVSVGIMSIVMLALNNFMLHMFRSQIAVQDSVEAFSTQTGLQSLLIQKGSCKKFLSSLGAFKSSELTSTEGVPVSIQIPGGGKVSEGKPIPGSNRMGVRKLRLTNAVAMAGSPVTEYISRLVIGFEKLGSTQIFREKELGVIKLTVKEASGSYNIEDCTASLDGESANVIADAAVKAGCAEMGGEWHSDLTPKCQVYCDSTTATDNGKSYYIAKAPAGTLLKIARTGMFELQFICVSGKWANITSMPAPGK